MHDENLFLIVKKSDLEKKSKKQSMAVKGQLMTEKEMRGWVWKKLDGPANPNEPIKTLVSYADDAGWKVFRCTSPYNI